MTDLKPKKLLDREMLRRAINYYRVNLSEDDFKEFENWECFSDPEFESHECNYRVKLPGNRKCEYCNNKADVPCIVSCDLQAFCLAVYAWRAGIGGEDFNKALQANLYKKTPDELYDEIIKVLVGIPIELVKTEEETDMDEDKTTEEVKSEEPEKHYTVSEAAKLKGCSYNTIYNAITKENLEYKEIDGRKVIAESVLREFKTRAKRLPKKERRKVKK